MITFLTGVPGSGKTYKAVVSIYNNFSTSPNAKKDLKKDYQFCYTNINELKYDKLHDVVSLDLDILKEKLSIVHELYKEKNTDDVLIEKCKELEIYRCLFVIDEAHNIFDTNDKLLVWWLSYHRHLYHDIFLITQNLSLIFTKYKSFSEFFYRAKATTLSLNNNTFKYDVFINSRMSNNAKSHTEKISKNQEVFDLYHSGDSVKTQNVILRLLIIASISIMFVVALLYFLIGYMRGDTVEPPVKSVKTQNIPDNKKDVSSAVSNVDNVPDNSFTYSNQNIFFTLNCSNSFCSNDDIRLPIDLVIKFVDSNDLTILHTEKTSSTYHKFYIDSRSDFYNYLTHKGDSNVKKNYSNNITDGLFSSGKQ